MKSKAKKETNMEDKKIIVRMRGGLGNQLFIISFAFYLRELVRDVNRIELDLNEYKKYKIRNFELDDLFSDPLPRYSPKQDAKYEINRKFFHVLSRLDRSNYKPIASFFEKKGMYFSKRNGFDLKIYNQMTYYVYGYFQDVRMASKVKEQVLNLINTVDNNLIDSKKKTICVSVRIGDDYKKNGWPICSKEYFTNAITEIVNEKYKNQDYDVIVFSDEINKAKEFFHRKNYKYVEGMSAPEQLNLMLKCDDFVLSNSSFSWWGAFLGKKKNSIVIMPDFWYPKERTESTLLVFDGVRIRGI